MLPHHCNDRFFRALRRPHYRGFSVIYLEYFFIFKLKTAPYNIKYQSVFINVTSLPNNVRQFHLVTVGRNVCTKTTTTSHSFIPVKQTHKMLHVFIRYKQSPWQPFIIYQMRVLLRTKTSIMKKIMTGRQNNIVSIVSENIRIMMSRTFLIVRSGLNTKNIVFPYFCCTLSSYFFFSTDV